MRRLWLALPAFLGAACIAAAIAIPLFLVPQLRVVPLDLDITSEATTVSEDGSTGDRFPARVFDRCSVNERRAQVDDAHLSQQRRSVIVDPSDRRQATLQSAQTVQIDRLRDADGEETEPTMAAADAARECNDGLLTANIDRVSVNRKSSVPNGTVSSLQLEAAPEGVNPQDVSVELPDRQGFQYKFGFDVQKRSYLYYDTNTRQDIPVEFVGEKTIDGVTVYEFSGEVPETDVSSLPNAQGQAALGTILTMPASWWGISGRGVEPRDQVTMHRYATATRTVWVEPETGTIVDGMEDQHQYFRSPDQSDDTPAPIRDFQMDVLKARFKWTDETVSNQAARADDYMGQLRLGNFWLPLILAVVGVVLLGVWALMWWRGRRRGDHDTTPPADDPATTSWLGESRGEHSPTVAADDAAGGGVAGAAGAAGAGAADGRAGGAHAADPWDQPTEQIPRVESAPDNDSATQAYTPPDDDETQHFRRPPSE
ncbi:DUF3068 domain-containing protein [Gordonia sp. Z-3]|uniref:DUF3068 domain-containing protein n=1 Tax=Gordonia aquimaris TaxID=2984863 RepID=A0A9X3D321_9ACTN|nr:MULTISPECIES: DUF3068 domain-containing protein [Gordonia]MAU81293.1 hypothetical protein [Gordonia sp. (in: high G+C Gram-positive bacteria)]MCX2963604.1 DUF3068 domain-containing protein [Gordonia aquimaris]MED5803550.1 DUF3068 domain-containing protein [Gordonia sp. Z-3]